MYKRQLLYCADALKFRRSVDWTLSLAVSRMARPQNTHTRTHRSIVRSFHKTKTLKYGYCCTVAATTSKAYGVIQATSSSSSQHSKMKKSNYKLNGTSIRETVFLATAVGPCNDTHTHARSQSCRSTVRGCHEQKSLKRGGCTLAA